MLAGDAGLPCCEHAIVASATAENTEVLTSRMMLPAGPRDSLFLVLSIWKCLRSATILRRLRSDRTCDSGVASWYDFTLAIAEDALSFGVLASSPPAGAEVTATGYA